MYGGLYMHFGSKKKAAAPIAHAPAKKAAHAEAAHGAFFALLRVAVTWEVTGTICTANSCVVSARKRQFHFSCPFSLGVHQLCIVSLASLATGEFHLKDDLSNLDDLFKNPATLDKLLGALSPHITLFALLYLHLSLHFVYTCSGLIDRAFDLPLANFLFLVLQLATSTKRRSALTVFVRFAVSCG